MRHPPHSHQAHRLSRSPANALSASRRVAIGLRRILAFLFILLGATPRLASPAGMEAPMPATESNGAGKVVVSGMVPNEKMKAALLTQLGNLLQPGQLADQLKVGESHAPHEWQALLPRLAVPGLKSISHGMLHIEGKTVSLQGQVASADMAELIGNELRKELPPDYTLRNQLRADSAGKADQDLLDRTLSNRVIEFQNGSAALTPAGKAIVDEMAFALKKLSLKSVAVIGHTDDQGTSAGNLLLSQSRADAVKAYMVEKGIPASGIRTSGMGAAQPVASNATEDGRRRNRRIEFRVD